MHFWLQNAPWAPRASLTTRQTRSKLKNRKVHFLRFLCWNPSLMENWFSIISIFENEFCNSFFVQKSIIPPLRTKRYYSKPKWRSRRHKSLKMRKNTTFHLFAPKSHSCSKSAFWSYFYLFELFLHFWLQMAQKSIKKPLLPQAFEPLGPKNAFWAPKCVKC